MNAPSADTLAAAETTAQEAALARQQGQWADALGKMEVACKLAPEIARYHSSRGADLFMLHRYDEAAWAYEKARELDPHNKHILNNLAVVYTLTQRHREAEPLLHETLALDENQKEAWLNLCSAVEGLDFRERDVVTYAQRAVQLDPQDPRPYQYLGKALLRQGDPQGALEALQTSVRLAPRDVNARYGLGIAHMEIGNIAEAAQSFQAALELDPGHGATYYALAEFLYRLEDYPAAEEAARHAEEHLNDKISPAYLLAKTLFAQDRFSEAKEVYDRYRARYHAHRDQQLGKRRPGDKAALLPLLGADEWSRRKEGRFQECLPARPEPRTTLQRFGHCPPDPAHPAGTIPHAYIADIRKAIIIPGHEIILVDNEKTVLYDRLVGVQDANNLMEDEVVRLARAGCPQVVVDMGPTTERTVREGIFLLSQFWYNYAHWLLEQLPRLWLIEQRPDLKKLPLIINEGLYHQQEESLELIDRDRHPLIVLPRGGRVRVDRLIYPSSLTSSMVMRYRPGATASSADVTFHPEATAFLRERLLPQCAPNPTGGRRLWVSRRTKIQAGNRRLLNEADLEALFIEHGFEPVVPETLSFREQIATFADAEMIAGAAGAGMINSLFAPKHARILMFTKNHPQVNFHYFTYIAESIGQRIAYVCGDSLQNFGLHGFESDFTIDLADARRALTDFLGL